MSFDDISLGIERAHDGAGGLALRWRCGIELVQHDDVGELDLLDQEIDQRALVAVKRLAALAEEIGRGVVLQEVRGVDHGDHAPKAGSINRSDE